MLAMFRAHYTGIGMNLAPAEEIQVESNDGYPWYATRGDGRGASKGRRRGWGRGRPTETPCRQIASSEGTTVEATNLTMSTRGTN